MPRTRRLIPSEYPLHIMVRGNNKQALFRGDHDKQNYLRLLWDFKSEHEIEIYHYCLMNNHVHILLQARNPKLLSKFMLKVDLSYFFCFNSKYGYVGHLFQNRFKSNIINRDSYMLQCGKYIELNPVRAGLSLKPEDYFFSSYRRYALGERNLLITANPLYMGLADRDALRAELYREFVVDAASISAEKIRCHVYIGSDEFVTRMEHLYGVPSGRRPRGRPSKE
jgi:putative transposase